MGCASLAAVAGRWASGTESIGALQLKPAQPQLLASRCSAAGGRRLGAQSSVRPPASSQRPPACITTNQQPLGRAKSADGPASAASHRSNMAFLSTRTSTPPGRGPVNKPAFAHAGSNVRLSTAAGILLGTGKKTRRVRSIRRSPLNKHAMLSKYFGELC